MQTADIILLEKKVRQTRFKKNKYIFIKYFVFTNNINMFISINNIQLIFCVKNTNHDMNEKDLCLNVTFWVK